MLTTYNRALAPGTYVNRAKQAYTYVKFCVLYNVPVLHPSIVQVAMYSQYLANMFKPISTVKNYMSGARTWVHEHDGDVHPFLSSQAEYMIKSLTKASTHVVKRALPLTVDHLSIIAAYLDSSPVIPKCIKSCIFLGYSCYLRASNLLMSGLNMLTGPHTLLAKHVTIIPQGLKVTIKSTKSKAQPYVLTVNYNLSYRICPVRAWIDYVNSMSINQNGPAFMINRSTPLTPIVVVKCMRDALRDLQDIDANSISMHSLRRGAAQAADTAGLPIPDIMKRGGWASRSGLKPYLTS